MLKTALALALVAISGNALAFQQQPAPTEEAAETVTPVGEAAVPDQVPSEIAAQPAEADEGAAAEDEVSDQDNYRAAARAYSRCRQSARNERGIGAVETCASQRRRMLAAKEVLRGAK